MTARRPAHPVIFLRRSGRTWDGRNADDRPKDDAADPVTHWTREGLGRWVPVSDCGSAGVAAEGSAPAS